MPVTMYAHLPGVRLDDAANGIALGPGRVESLPFERWLSLDGRFGFAGKEYDRSRPTFWVGELPISELAGRDAIAEAASSLLWRLHVVFLLEPRAPLLPTPMLSAQYFVFAPPPGLAGGPELPVVMRFVGPVECEWIVFGSPLDVGYDAADLDTVGKTLPLLDEAGRFAGVDAAVETLERTARPDSWWGGDDVPRRASEFVQCIAACESILLPHHEEIKPGKKTETFGQHGAVLLARSRGDLVAWGRKVADLYRLRSRLVHGRVGLRELDRTQLWRLAAGRLLLREVVLSAMALGRSAGSPAESLPHLLSKALADPVAHDALSERLMRS